MTSLIPACSKFMTSVTALFYLCGFQPALAIAFECTGTSLREFVYARRQISEPSSFTATKVFVDTEVLNGVEKISKIYSVGDINLMSILVAIHKENGSLILSPSNITGILSGNDIATFSLDRRTGQLTAKGLIESQNRQWSYSVSGVCAAQ